MKRIHAWSLIKWLFLGIGWFWISFHCLKEFCSFHQIDNILPSDMSPLQCMLFCLGGVYKGCYWWTSKWQLKHTDFLCLWLESNQWNPLQWCPLTFFNFQMELNIVGNFKFIDTVDSVAKRLQQLSSSLSKSIAFWWTDTI